MPSLKKEKFKSIGRFSDRMLIMLAYFELMRIWNSLIAVFGFLVAAFVAGVAISSNTALVFATIIVFLQTSAGNVLNDYFDYRIDKINRPNRPLPSGGASLSSARSLGVFLFLVSIGLAFQLPQAMLALALFNALLSAAYSWRLKRTPAGHFIVSWLTASLFIFAALLSSITLLTWILFGMVFCISMVREIAKGIEDFRGDSKMGAATLEVVLGKPTAHLFAITFAALGIILTFLPYGLGYFKLFYFILIAIADAAVLYSLILIKENPGAAQRILKYVMLLTLIAFIAGLY